jgi:hypothetical protein
MSQKFLIMFLTLFGTRVVAIDESLVTQPNSNHWFVDPQIRQNLMENNILIESSTRNTQSQDNFEDIPLEIRLIGIDRDTEDNRTNRNTVTSIFHNPKIIGIVLGMMLIILATLIYFLVNRFKSHEE